MHPYILAPKAQLEYENAVEWYADRSVRTALKFIESVEKTINLIRVQPNQPKKIHKSFRETSIEKFPFTIVYTVDDEMAMIVIISIFHQKRNPKSKYKKLKGK